MTPSLSTQIFRALSALPLLAVALVAAAGAGLPPVDGVAESGGVVVEFVVPAASATGLAIDGPTQGAATTLPGDAVVLPGDALAAGPRLDCAAGVPAPGARGLARMPGDITTVADRLRCAQ